MKSPIECYSLITSGNLEIKTRSISMVSPQPWPSSGLSVVSLATFFSDPYLSFNLGFSSLPIKFVQQWLLWQEIDELVNGLWDDALSDVNTNVTSFAFKVHKQHFGEFHFEWSSSAGAECVA